REHELHVALDVRLDRPAVDADRVVEVAAAEDVVLGQHVLADEAPRLADADLRRDLDDIRVLEAGRHALDELEDVPALTPPLDLAVAELAGIDAADRRAVRVLDLRQVRAPFDRVALRPNDRLLARELPAFALGPL